MTAALRSAITLSPAPLEDAEDGFVQVELPSFGHPEHRAEVPVRLAHRTVLPLHGMAAQHHANGSRLEHMATREGLRLARIDLRGQVRYT
jgi:hypothetical protein